MKIEQHKICELVYGVIINKNDIKYLKESLMSAIKVIIEQLGLAIVPFEELTLYALPVLDMDTLQQNNSNGCESFGFGYNGEIITATFNVAPYNSTLPKGEQNPLSEEEWVVLQFIKAAGAYKLENVVLEIPEVDVRIPEPKQAVPTKPSEELKQPTPVKTDPLPFVTRKYTEKEMKEKYLEVLEENKNNSFMNIRYMSSSEIHRIFENNLPNERELRLSLMANGGLVWTVELSPSPYSIRLYNIGAQQFVEFRSAAYDDIRVPALAECVQKKDSQMTQQVNNNGFMQHLSRHYSTATPSRGERQPGSPTLMADNYIQSLATEYANKLTKPDGSGYLVTKELNILDAKDLMRHFDLYYRGKVEVVNAKKDPWVELVKKRGGLPTVINPWYYDEDFRVITVPISPKSTLDLAFKAPMILRLHVEPPLDVLFEMDKTLHQCATTEKLKKENQVGTSRGLTLLEAQSLLDYMALGGSDKFPQLTVLTPNELDQGINKVFFDARKVIPNGQLYWAKDANGKVILHDCRDTRDNSVDYSSVNFLPMAFKLDNTKQGSSDAFADLDEYVKTLSKGFKKELQFQPIGGHPKCSHKLVVTKPLTLNVMLDLLNQINKRCEEDDKSYRFRVAPSSELGILVNHAGLSWTYTCLWSVNTLDEVEVVYTLGGGSKESIGLTGHEKNVAIFQIVPKDEYNETLAFGHGGFSAMINESEIELLKEEWKNEGIKYKTFNVGGVIYAVPEKIYQRDETRGMALHNAIKKEHACGFVTEEIMGLLLKNPDYTKLFNKIDTIWVTGESGRKTDIFLEGGCYSRKHHRFERANCNRKKGCAALLMYFMGYEKTKFN